MKKSLFYLLFLCSSLQNLQGSDDLQKIQNRISSLDHIAIDEIIHALDLIVEELPTFIDKYELDSELSWIEWKRKYWLLAPIGVIALGVKLYFLLAIILKSPKNNKVYSFDSNVGKQYL